MTPPTPKRAPTFWDKLRGRVDQDALSDAPKGLTIRKVADSTKGTREARYNERTGEKFLFDPETQLPKPWPLMGILIEGGGAPQSAIIPSDYVMNARDEGWMTLENYRVVHRSGGPPENPWKVTHTFHQADAITIHTLEGDVRYKIVHQPDKYEDSTEPGMMRVDWFYLCELEPADG